MPERSRIGEGPISERIEALRGLLTLDELTNRVGMTVRTIRFYATRGIVPPPIRRGRSGYYTPTHVARLELAQELQSHGFTLAAIERYVAGIPEDAGPEDIALYRTMLAPWQSELPVKMTRAELCDRAGRRLSADDVETLVALRVLQPAGRGHYRVAVSQLTVGLTLLDLEFPREAAEAAAEVYAAHGRAVAEELTEIFRTQVRPAYRGPARTGTACARLWPASSPSPSPPSSPLMRPRWTTPPAPSANPLARPG